jgi:hypothetical protein
VCVFMKSTVPQRLVAFRGVTSSHSLSYPIDRRLWILLHAPLT